MTTVRPFLMFQDGDAEAAMDLYMSLFPDSEILEIERYGAGEQGAEGTLKRAHFTVAGQGVLCMNSPTRHDFSFTPSFSFFIECESAEQISWLFAALSEDGRVLMPLGSYGFSRQFGWTNDRFGVSWQLNLA
jgi:predicted 3-demethylubiquinone-9 3-methyltransferase (glyoxalase superfamily)